MGSVVEPSIDLSTITGERSLLSRLLAAGAGGLAGAAIMAAVSRRIAPALVSRGIPSVVSQAVGTGLGAGAGALSARGILNRPWASEVAEQAGINAGRPYPWGAAGDEIVELAEEIGKFNPAGIREEMGDAMMASQLAAYKNLKLDTPVFFPATEAGSKYVSRRRSWEQAADAYGLKFDVNKLAGGSNYEREGKRDRIIMDLMRDQGVSTATLNRDRLPAHIAQLDWRPSYTL